MTSAFWHYQHMHKHAAHAANNAGYSDLLKAKARNAPGKGKAMNGRICAACKKGGDLAHDCRSTTCGCERCRVRI
jgi:hypothetical protein